MNIIQKVDFLTAIQELVESVHDNAVKKGFYVTPPEEGTAIALMHSELSEALDSARHGNPPSDHIPAFSGIEEELADVVIRIADWCGHKGYDLGGAILAKQEFNAGRPHMHNKLF